MKKRSSIQNALNNHLSQDEKIITVTKGEIGAYSTNSCVIISGIPFDDNSLFYKELNLIVITNKCCKKVSLKAGYNPRVLLLDFNGYGNEIYVTIDSGGSGGFQFFYIFEYENCDLNILMSDDIYNSKYNNYSGRYLDHFRAQVTEKSNVWRIDLSCKGYDYLSQIYYVDGKLIKPQKIYISGANYTFPQYFQYYGRYALVVYQSITGLYQADSLGYMEMTLKFENDEHEVSSVYLKTQKNSRDNCIVL